MVDTISSCEETGGKKGVLNWLCGACIYAWGVIGLLVIIAVVSKVF